MNEKIEAMLNDNSLASMNEKQIKILDAAIKVFSEKGYDGAKTADVAKEAGVSEALVFKYFKSKKDLLSALLLPLISKVLKPIIFKSMSHFLKVQEEVPIEDALLFIMKDRIDLFEKNLPLLKTIFIEVMHHPDAFEPIKQDIMPSVIGFVDAYLEKYIKDGIVKDIDRKILTRSFMSLLMGYLVSTNFYPEFFKNEDTDEDLKTVIDILLNGIRK